MKRTFLKTEQQVLDTLSNRQSLRLKNFLPPRILKNNFMADAQVTHFVLPQTLQAATKAKQKEPLFPTLYDTNVYFLVRMYFTKRGIIILH